MRVIYENWHISMGSLGVRELICQCGASIARGPKRSTSECWRECCSVRPGARRGVRPGILGSACGRRMKRKLELSIKPRTPRGPHIIMLPAPQLAPANLAPRTCACLSHKSCTLSAHTHALLIIVTRYVQQRDTLHAREVTLPRHIVTPVTY